jgi:aconitate hydratase
MSYCVNSFKTKSILFGDNQSFTYFSLSKLADAGFKSLPELPFCIRILLENLLRNEDGLLFTAEQIESLATWNTGKSDVEIPFLPARVLLQDFTGVPAVVDLAAMRDAAKHLIRDPLKINPRIPAELVIDHSVQIDSFGQEDSLEVNIGYEFSRNSERYSFLRWGQKNFDNFRVVPPGTGICHQVNLEYLARIIFIKETEGEKTLFPDSVLGLDSHTTMINGTGVIGWGVGGIEAEAVMLGNPYYLLMPKVLGFKLTGKLPDNATSTDLVLCITELLRKKGVVGKFVEFYGSGLSNLSVENRATIANMAPEYGATMGLFPVDDITLKYLRLTGRPGHIVSLAEKYYREQGLFLENGIGECVYNETVEFDMSAVQPCIAGPKRPQERIPLFQVKTSINDAIKESGYSEKRSVQVDIDGTRTNIGHGSVVIAAITSCTNTSNPSVMIGAGLLAKKAVLRGLSVKPWVKTSLAPGSRIAADYLEKSGIMTFLKRLKFHITAYGCATCIGNSGPLNKNISEAIKGSDLFVASVLSGNRNFEGRISPYTKANFLASPPLVVAYAIAGKIDIDFSSEPLGFDINGKPVFLEEIWPSAGEISALLENLISPEMFKNGYSSAIEGPEKWRSLPASEKALFDWDPDSTYIRNPPFFDKITSDIPDPRDIRRSRVLVLLGDMVTTDHISPAGSIPPESPAGKYLAGKGVSPDKFNSFGSRRGNHEVMIRGAFGNIRLKNRLVPDISGGWTLFFPDEKKMTIYDASEKYKESGTPLIVIAGREYGTGSSRDWAAKGTVLLGVKAVIAESFERIHRSNLICTGVLPLQFQKGEGQEKLKLDGTEIYDITGIEKDLYPGKKLFVSATRKDGGLTQFTVTARIDSKAELNYYIHGGILPYVLRNLG